MNGIIPRLCSLLLMTAVLNLILISPIEASRFIDNSIKPIYLHQIFRQDSHFDGRSNLLDAELTLTYVDNMSNSAIAKALEYESQVIKDEHNINANYYLNTTLDYRNTVGDDYFYTGFHYDDAIIRRADSRVVSILNYDCAHYAEILEGPRVYAKNFDSNTGKLLTLDDIIYDKNQLVKILNEQLIIAFPDEYYNQNNPEFNTLVTSAIHEYVYDNYAEFTIDPEGITFFFNPMESGSFVSAIVATTIRFDDYPNIFNPYYCYMANAYATEAIFEAPVYLDAGNGAKQLSLAATDSGLYIAFDDKSIYDDRAYEVRVYALKMADGSCYAYADCVITGDLSSRRELRIYDLNGSSIRNVATLDMSIAKPLMNSIDNYDANIDPHTYYYEQDMLYPITNPNHFYLHDLNTNRGNYYRVGANGLPELLY